VSLREIDIPWFGFLYALVMFIESVIRVSLSHAFAFTLPWPEINFA